MVQQLQDLANLEVSNLFKQSFPGGHQLISFAFSSTVTRSTPTTNLNLLSGTGGGCKRSSRASDSGDKEVEEASKNLPDLVNHSIENADGELNWSNLGLKVASDADSTLSTTFLQKLQEDLVLNTLTSGSLISQRAKASKY